MSWPMQVAQAGQSVASKLNEDMDYDYMFKFLTLGDSGVGKTSFLQQYTEGKFESKFHSTVGIDFVDKKIVFKSEKIEGKRKRIYLQLWDTAGQERFRSITTSFYRSAVGFIIMFDLTNEESFHNIRPWIEQLRQHSVSDKPDIVLCGNKADLRTRQMVTWQRANAEASKYGVQYFETSAASGENVSVVVEALVELVLIRMNKVVQNQAANSLYSDALRLLGPPKQDISQSNCSC